MHLQFTSWYPLSQAGAHAHAPRGPAALQVRVEDGLVAYPTGHRSAMVCYVYASENAHQTLQDLFCDELQDPGTRGHGPLMFRFIDGSDEALVHLQKLLHKFHTQFGDFPLFNQKQSD